MYHAIDLYIFCLIFWQLWSHVRIQTALRNYNHFLISWTAVILSVIRPDSRLKNVQQWYPVFASIPVWHPAVTSWSGRILLFSRDCGMHCRHPYLSWKSRKWPACCIRQAPGIFEWVPHSWWLLLYHLCRCPFYLQQ